jgi:hypothetical protein
LREAGGGSGAHRQGRAMDTDPPQSRRTCPSTFLRSSTPFRGIRLLLYVLPRPLRHIQDLASASAARRKSGQRSNQLIRALLIVALFSPRNRSVSPLPSGPFLASSLARVSRLGTRHSLSRLENRRSGLSQFVPFFCHHLVDS